MNQHMRLPLSLSIGHAARKARIQWRAPPAPRLQALGRAAAAPLEVLASSIGPAPLRPLCLVLLPTCLPAIFVALLRRLLDRGRRQLVDAEGFELRRAEDVHHARRLKGRRARTGRRSGRRAGGRMGSRVLGEGWGGNAGGEEVERTNAWRSSSSFSSEAGSCLIPSTTTLAKGAPRTGRSGVRRRFLARSATWTIVYGSSSVTSPLQAHRRARSDRRSKGQRARVTWIPHAVDASGRWAQRNSAHLSRSPRRTRCERALT